MLTLCYCLLVSATAWVLLWYGISVSFTIANKWIFFTWRGGFPFPVLMTACHMTVKYMLSRCVMRSRGGAPPALGRRVYWRTAAPIGVLTALDVLLSNSSLMFITVTFYTISKVSSSKNYAQYRLLSYA
jgi:solute carrier family 35, member C2